MSHNFKILVIGDRSVGKTAICSRYVHCVFKEKFPRTHGVDHFLKSIIYQKQRLNLFFWDVSDEEHNYRIYKDASLCIVVFSLVNRESFGNIMKWKKNLDKYLKLANSKRVPSILLANMCDIPDIEIKDNDIKKSCETNKFLSWIKVSAKTNFHMKTFSEYIVQTLMKS